MKDKVLRLLRDNARLSEDQIARRLGASPEEVRKTVEELEQTRAILGYTSVINPAALSEEPVEAIIGLRVIPKRDHGFDDIARRIGGFPQVRSLYLMSGGTDFLVFVEASSIREVAQFVTEKLATIEDVQSTTTHFMLKRYKKDGVVLQEEAPSCRLAVSP